MFFFLHGFSRGLSPNKKNVVLWCLICGSLRDVLIISFGQVQKGILRCLREIAVVC